MILRRLSTHVKEQNWFAVGLDFFIVVFGVFIGIQVANWNETRIELKEEQAILARLTDEYRVIQLITSGDLRLIMSDRVRSALLNHSAEREEAMKAIGFNHGLEPAALGNPLIQAVFQSASPNPVATLDAALNDPELADGLRAWYGMRYFNDNWFERVHGATKQVLDVLEVETAKQ